MIPARAAVVFAAASCLWAQPRQDTRTLTAPRQEYTIAMGGTEDGTNTRDPIVYNAWKPGYEPMRSVRIENTGETDVVNPRIVVNGKRDWRTTADIVREALASYGNPATDSDKARAIWEFQRLHRFHATTGDFEVRDPVKMFNVYGYSLCGDNAAVLMELWRAAGLQSRRGYPVGHCVAEAWYDGGWHMMDADESILFLDRDNRTVLPESAVARDPDLARRAYQSDILTLLYDHDGTHTGDFAAHSGHSMDFTLRPGESIEWRWGQGARFHSAPPPVTYNLESADLHRWGANAWATLRNGRWTYAPPLDRAAGQRAAEAVNVRWASGKAAAAVAGRTASLTWKMRSPYVMVGGRVDARVEGRARVSVSYDGREWRDVPADGGLDFLFPNPGSAHYEYFVRVELDPGATLSAITIANDVQMAPLSMPELELGTNRIRYADDSGGPRSVKATFEWTERGGSKAPEAPRNGVVTAGRFEWASVAGAVAYHFELADHAGMRWALSPAFTSVEKGNSFRAPSAGLLSPGQTYYWRVRAKSEAGLWGPWSEVWRYTPAGPGVPARPRFEEREPEHWTLTWDPGPAAKPARYRVYGSDEKGFTATAADVAAESDGPAVKIDPVRAFYRVAAVDASGKAGGASDYVEAPRPWIYTSAERTARVGQPYRYEARTVRSAGHRGYRWIDEKYVSGVWDADQPVFSLDEEFPRCGGRDAKWLRIDPRTGVLSGVPGEADAGEYQINVRVVIGGKAHVQSYPLRVVK